jgi:hypothetical protein
MHLLLLQRQGPPVEPSLDTTNTRSAEEADAGATEPACTAAETDGSADTPSECTNSEPGERGSPRDDDPCKLLGADAPVVANLCYQYAVKMCNGPLERWPGVRGRGEPGEWDDEQLKDMRCLAEMVGVLQSYSQCLPSEDRKVICDKVLNYPDGKHAGFTVETMKLCKDIYT